MDIVRQANASLVDLVKILEQGGVLVFPTETAYGLVADSTSREAVAKIYKIKGRDWQKPLPVVCSSIGQVENFFVLSKQARTIAEKYWPGPLSIVLPIKNLTKPKLKVVVNPNSETAAVRVTALDFLRDLAEEFARPLTATSANISGRQTLYKEKEVLSEFENCPIKPDLIVLAGDLPQVLPSTIIEFVNGGIKVLRPGPIDIN